MDIVTIPWLIGFQPSQIAAAAIGGILHMDPKPKGVYAFLPTLHGGMVKEIAFSQLPVAEFFGLW